MLTKVTEEEVIQQTLNGELAAEIAGRSRRVGLNVHEHLVDYEAKMNRAFKNVEAFIQSLKTKLMLLTVALLISLGFNFGFLTGVFL